MPATEKAIAWLSQLSERQFVGTESRLLTLFDLLKQISEGSEADPAKRIAELHKKRDEIDAEIARVVSGDVPLLDDTASKTVFSNSCRAPASCSSESEHWLAIEHGSIKATVLIETILAAFEMDEILYELRDHSAGLNAGRWDYIFSIIKKFRNDPTRVLPDREQITMTVPFMKAYTDLLVATCHKRGAHAMGGMAAFIPNRRDPDITARALEKVSADKRREATDGCDGTWVAHPDLVPVAQAEFDAVLGDRPNQIMRHRLDVEVGADDLLTTTVDGGTITEAGIRTNVNVGILYIASWLRGNGAAALLQPDGRRRHGRDLPEPNLAVGEDRLLH